MGIRATPFCAVNAVHNRAKDPSGHDNPIDRGIPRRCLEEREQRSHENDQEADGSCEASRQCTIPRDHPGQHNGDRQRTPPHGIDHGRRHSRQPGDGCQREEQHPGSRPGSTATHGRSECDGDIDVAIESVFVSIAHSLAGTLA